MEPQRAPDEPTSSQVPTPARRSQRELSIVQKTSYSLDELPALIERLRHEESTPEETHRLQRLARRVNRLRAKLPPIDVDDLIRQVREESLVD